MRLKQKGFPCKQCGCLIHRKCAIFDQDTLRHIKKDINSWNCSTCKALQFPFMNLTDLEINGLTFNSNFNCICQESGHENVLENGMTNDFIEHLNLPQLQLNEYSSDHSTDVDEQINLKCNFDYYSMHRFDKLKNNTNIRNSLSVFATNISLLTANFEKLAMLLYEINHKFDIAALTET